MPTEYVPPNGGPGGWVEYRNRVLYQLDTLTDKVEALDRKLSDVHTDMIILKTKSALYGGAFGLAVSILVEIGVHLFKGKI